MQFVCGFWIGAPGARKGARMGLLTVRECKAATVDPGKKFKVLSDGIGLYLRISEAPTQRRGLTTRYWIAKVTFHGKRFEIGLGNLNEVSLAEARAQNEALRVKARQGIDPRRKTGDAVPTFKEAVDLYLVEKLAEFKNPKHKQQWANTLDQYAKTLHRMRVDTIEADDVVRTLKPIWRDKTETASRVRGRIENVLSWAAANKYRTGENPARWKGSLEHLLPNPTKLKKAQHHASMPYAELPNYMAKLAPKDSVAALALQWLILTGTRSGEARGAAWDEIDLQAGVWTIPAERTKTNSEHRVPLSTPAMAIAHRLQGLDEVNLFSTGKAPISETAVRKLLKESAPEGTTMHGFRTTLRTWMQDINKTLWEVAEMTLAHKVGNEASQAYARSDQLEARREVLDDWAEYINSKGR